MYLTWIREEKFLVFQQDQLRNITLHSTKVQKMLKTFQVATILKSTLNI